MAAPRNAVGTTPSTTEPPRPGRRRLGLVALVLGLLIIGLDATILTVALPTLATDLEASTTELQWFTDAYTLPFAALLLPLGVLGDRLGRRLVLVSGLLVFAVGSVIAMLVDTSGGLVLSRVVMGAGAAAIAPLALAIVPLLFPPDERPRAVALATAGFALGLPLGPLVGGWLLNSFWWGSIFLINLPVIALAVAGALMFVPETRDPHAKRLDLVGSALALVGISALVYGVIEAPNDGWTDPVVLSGMLGGAALVVLLVVWLSRAANPLVDIALFRNARFAWATVTVSLVMFILLGVLFVVPQFLQQVQGHDAMATGIRLLPMIGTLLVATVAGDKMVARFGTKVVVAAGMVLWAIGLAVLASLSADSDYAITATALAIVGAGLGLSLPTTLDAVLGSLPPDRAGAGSALANTCRQIGAAVGIAVLGSVMNSVYRGRVDEDAPARLTGSALAAVRDNVAGAEAVARRLPTEEGRVVSDLAQDAFVAGMSAASWVCVGVAVMTAVLVAALLPARESTGNGAPAADAGAKATKSVGR
ncbi:DHA2 family efflux MFS transporter permease subunit [Streptomyces sp. NPDC020845]|uniref:DHA2 family efflux MFS transporter permease subunit n=1 Tax=Streptomyces sp. NPDC020845 TaxID=3365096 RepID=UPI0037971E0E